MSGDNEITSQAVTEDSDGVAALSEDLVQKTQIDTEESCEGSKQDILVEENTTESLKISELEKRNRELEEALLRAKAESDNVRKRAAKDIQSAHKFGTEKFIKEILPLKDSLEMGVESTNDGTEIASIHEGFSLTLKMFSDVLGRLEVKELDPIGETFDPERHQAMTTEFVEGKPAGLVLKVFQKGYLLHDRLVRPALVVVSSEKVENSS